MNIEQIAGEYTKTKYAMYLRKSRADLDLEKLGEGETLEKHHKMLVALAERNNILPEQITVYKEIVSGESISARPEMQRLLDDVYAREYAGVMVVEVERLARGNTKDQGEVAEAFQYSDTKIMTPTKIYDPNNEFDQEYFEFGLFMSRREYKTIRRRMEAGKLMSVQDGNYIGSAQMLGYDIVRKSKKDRTLVENKDSRIVHMIFDWFTEDRLNVGEIAKKLSEMHIPTPRGNDVWHRASIKDILLNVHYTGKVRWKNREYVKIMVDGKIVRQQKRNDPSSYQVYEGKHKGFISEEQFEKAQKLFADSTPVKLELNIVNPLAGILVCNVCNKTIKYQGYTTKPNTTPRFAHTTEGSNCKKKSLPVAQVLEAVVQALKDEIANCEYKIANDDNKAERQKHHDLIESMKAELKNQQQRKNRLMDSWDSDDGMYTKEEYIERKQMYTVAIDELKKKIDEAENAMPDHVDFSEKIVTLHSLIDCIESPDIDGKSKNNFLKQFIYKIYYDVEDFGFQKGGRAILDIHMK